MWMTADRQLSLLGTRADGRDCLYSWWRRVMEFARRQLEKYGWSEGKGLGRHENGISKALRPKLKRSSAGVGHEAGTDFTDHWWSALYDKASGNIEVERTDGDAHTITTVDAGAVVISDKSWQINNSHKKKKKNDKTDGYMDNFVKTAVLTSGGAKTQRLLDDKDDESNVTGVNMSAVTLTDEELFAACGGRTAHKGARHGLRAMGKLARIEQQEKALLMLPQYNGYSHAKPMETHSRKQNSLKDVSEKIEKVSFEDVSKNKKKRKKKKYCKVVKDYDHAPEIEEEDGSIETSNTGRDKTLQNSIKELIETDNVVQRNKQSTIDTEPTKKERDYSEMVTDLEEMETGSVSKRQKNKRNSTKIVDVAQPEMTDTESRKRKKERTVDEITDGIDASAIISDENKKVARSKKNKQKCENINIDISSTEQSNSKKRRKNKNILNEMDIGEEFD